MQTAVQRAVLGLFVRFIERDHALHRQIELHHAGTVKNTLTWQFTLQQLHHLVVASAAERCMTDKTDGDEETYATARLLAAVDHLTFRQALYTSHLNGDLRALHASLGIADNHGKLDRNVYCLNVHKRGEL